MAVTTATLAGNVVDLGWDPLSAKPLVWVEANSGALVDTTGNRWLIGSKTLTVDASGNFSVELVTTNSDDIEPAENRQYRVVVKGRNGKPGVDAKTESRDSGWFFLTADATLASRIAVDYLEPGWATAKTAEIQALVDEAEAARDDTVTISGLTGEDAAVGALVAGTGGAGAITRAALSASIAGLAGAGSDDWLKAVAGAGGFGFTTLTTVETATGLPTAATVKWPDGKTGAFTGTSDGINGYTGFVVTHVDGATTKTVTVSGITYDPTTGLALGPTSLAVA